MVSQKSGGGLKLAPISSLPFPLLSRCGKSLTEDRNLAFCDRAPQGYSGIYAADEHVASLTVLDFY